jgi:hypothetical protein
MLSPFDIEHMLLAKQMEADGQARRARQLAEISNVRPPRQSLRGATACMFVHLGLKLDREAVLDRASLAWDRT